MGSGPTMSSSPPPRSRPDDPEKEEGRWGPWVGNPLLATRRSQASTHFLQGHLDRGLSSPFQEKVREGQVAARLPRGVPFPSSLRGGVIREQEALDEPPQPPSLLPSPAGRPSARPAFLPPRCPESPPGPWLKGRSIPGARLQPLNPGSQLGW